MTNNDKIINKDIWINIKIPPKKISNELTSALESIVIEWGRFEMALVADTSTMMAYPAVRILAEKPPRTFVQRVELWKKCINALYPTIKIYKNWAAEICSKGKVICRHRNRLIHGLWDISKFKETGMVRLVSYNGLEKIEKHEDLQINVQYLAAVHTDILAINGALAALITNRMVHASKGITTMSPTKAP